jgi:hypothetical protein
MRFSLSLSRFLWLGILPILMLFASDNRATAGCGDYVLVLPPGMTAAGESEPTDHSVPCHGPSCRKNPAVPSTPMPAPVQTHTQWSDALLVTLDDDNTLRSSTLTDSDDHASGVSADPIVHPPR